MIQQVEFSLRPLPRGFHLVTNEVMRNLPALPKTGTSESLRKTYQLRIVAERELRSGCET